MEMAEQLIADMQSSSQENVAIFLIWPLHCNFLKQPRSKTLKSFEQAMLDNQRPSRPLGSRVCCARGCASLTARRSDREFRL